MREGGIFAIKFCVSPGQEIKLPLLIAVMDMVGAGLKHAAWRNCANSIFVVFLWIMTFNFAFIVGIIFLGEMTQLFCMKWIILE